MTVDGAALGTGLHTHPEFGPRVAAEPAHTCAQPFVCAAKFAALTPTRPR